MANREDPTATGVPLPPASGSNTARDPSPRPLLVAARSSGPGLPSPAPLLTEPGRNVRRRRRPLSPAPGGSAARRSRFSHLDDDITFVPDEAMHSTPRPYVSAAAAAGGRPGEGGPSSPEERNNGDAAHFDDSCILHIDPDDVSSDSDSDFSPGQDDGDQVAAFNFYTYCSQLFRRFWPVSNVDSLRIL
jgi:hypothetical protein